MDVRVRRMRTFNTPFFPDVLVCSEVMGEGVDLHRFCRHVIHHDLAWNPSDIEQRTGRRGAWYDNAPDSAEHRLHNRVSLQAGVGCDILENAVERSRPERIVIRHRHMMLAALMRREPEMGALLPRDGIAKGFEQSGQIRPGHIPRQPRAHGARISSRTMCRRITFGAWPSSK